MQSKSKLKRSSWRDSGSCCILSDGDSLQSSITLHSIPRHLVVKLQDACNRELRVRLSELVSQSTCTAPEGDVILIPTRETSIEFLPSSARDGKERVRNGKSSQLHIFDDEVKATAPPSLPKRNLGLSSSFQAAKSHISSIFFPTPNAHINRCNTDSFLEELDIADPRSILCCLKNGKPAYRDFYITLERGASPEPCTAFCPSSAAQDLFLGVSPSTLYKEVKVGLLVWDMLTSMLREEVMFEWKLECGGADCKELLGTKLIVREVCLLELT